MKFDYRTAAGPAATAFMIGSAKSNNARAGNRCDWACPTSAPVFLVFVRRAVDDPGEEPVRPVLVRGFAGIDFLDFEPHALTVPLDRHLEPHDSFVREIGDMFDVVKERDRVVVASQEEDAAVDLKKSLEHRALAEGEIPGLAGYEEGGLMSGGCESRWVRIHHGARPSAKVLDQDSVVPRCSRG